jgi:glycosyltransferase involved in cell wall biosynthesis
MSEICVSIFILTYNQEEFIGQTIESVLKQKTDFRYQLVLGEDYSTDNTRIICEKYAEENPDKIKLLPSERNLGLINNFIRTFKECDGKYVAICDGDDYWIDPLKLQKQVNFLENNPAYSIVFTGIKFLYANGDSDKVVWDKLKETSNFEDLIFSNFIPSVTALFRNKQWEENFPNWINRFPYGDWPIYLWTTKNGDKIKYLKEVTAVYRKEIGVSEKLKKVHSDIAKVNLGIVESVFRDPNFLSQRELAKKSLQQHQFALMASYFRENKFSNSFSLAGDLLKNEPAKVFRTYLYLLKRAFLK